MPNQYHEYNEEEFNSLPWANDFMNADPQSNEFNNAMAEADKYYGPEWTDKQLENWGIQFEKEAEAGNVNPEQLPDNSPIQKEVEQLTDNNPHNDEIDDDAVEDFINQVKASQPSQRELDDSIRGTLRSNYAKELASNIAWSEAKESGIRGRSSGRESQIQDEMINDDSFQPDLNDINRLAKAAHGLDKTPEENDELKQALGKSYDDVIEKIENNEDKADANLLASEWLKAQGFSTAKSQNKLINKVGKFLLKEGKFPEIYSGPLGSLSARDKNKLLKQGYLAEGKPANRKYGLKSLDLYIRADLENRLKKLKDKSNLENFIEQHPVASADILDEGPLKEEAEQAIDGGVDAEVNNKAIEEDPPTTEELAAFRELQEAEDDNVGMGYNNGRVDDTDWKDNPTYHADPIDLSDDTYDNESTDSTSNVVDYGLEDQNQYVDDINDPTVVDTKAPEVDENDFVKSDVLPSADNVLELKPEEQETVTKAIEEAAPEEDKETYFGMLGLPHRQFDGSSHSSVNANNEQYIIDRLNHAGASSLGRLGGFSTGSGSVRPGTVSTGISKPHVLSEHVSSRAGGGNIPKSPNAAANAKIGSKPGNAVNGFVTSNGGSVSSGPVQKRSSLKPPKPAQLPNFTGHTAPIPTNQLGGIEDLHGALIERIKGMLDNLDRETRKKLGFSPTLYNYNGTPLNKLDGSTLVQLSEMLEDMQNG